jgi:SAM-dependent MidA family methyltransferase
VGSRIEVSSDGWQLVTSLARTVTERQGQVLIIDYGNDFNKPNTLRVSNQCILVFHSFCIYTTHMNKGDSKSQVLRSIKSTG